MKKQTLATTSTEPLPLTETEAKAIGEKLTSSFWRACGAWGEILAFGSLLARVEAHLTANLPSNERERGRYIKGTGLKGFLETYAPEVEERKARRFRDITMAVSAQKGISEPWRVFNTPPQELPPADRKKREEALAFTEEKSVHAVQLELGLFEKKQSATVKKYAPPAVKSAEEFCNEIIVTLAQLRDHTCDATVFNQMDRQQAGELKFAFAEAAKAVAAMHKEAWGGDNGR